MAYADADDLAAFFDVRIIADLVSDSGVANEAWKNSSIITQMLATASGRIDSALTVANYYLTDDLEDLTGNSLALLKEICCTLAMAGLVKRFYMRSFDRTLAAAI